MTRTGTIHAAHSPSGLRDLQGRMDEWQRLGEPVELLDRASVAERIGTERYYGGLLDHRAGTINPMGYCRGLARAADQAGATISTGLRVTRLQKEGAGWVVETDQGAVHAKAVILGTNAYTAIGYNGRGITTGTLFGKAMAGLLTGMDKTDLPLPITSLSMVPSALFYSRLYQTAFTANQVIRSIV